MDISSIFGVFGLSEQAGVLSIFLGSVIIWSFLNKTIQEKIILSSLLGLVITWVMKTEITLITQFSNVIFNLAFDNNIEGTLIFIQIFAILTLITLRLASDKEFIQTTWERRVMLGLILLFTLNFCIYILVTKGLLFSSYSQFISSISLPSSSLYGLILFGGLIFIFYTIVQKKGKNKLKKISKLKKEIRNPIIFAILVSILLSLFLYPNISLNNETQLGVTMTHSFSSDSGQMLISQNFTKTGGLLGWFPIFYKNIEMPKVVSTDNIISYEQSDRYFKFLSNHTNGVNIIIQGTRNITSDNISTDDGGRISGRNVFKANINLSIGNISLIIDRTTQSQNNVTYYFYNGILVNNADVQFSAKNVGFEYLDGQCTIQDAEPIGENFGVSPSSFTIYPSHWLATSDSGIYTYSQNKKGKEYRFYFIVNCTNS